MPPQAFAVSQAVQRAPRLANARAAIAWEECAVAPTARAGLRVREARARRLLLQVRRVRQHAVHMSVTESIQIVRQVAHLRPLARRLDTALPMPARRCSRSAILARSVSSVNPDIALMAPAADHRRDLGQHGDRVGRYRRRSPQAWNSPVRRAARLDKVIVPVIVHVESDRVSESNARTTCAVPLAQRSVRSLERVLTPRIVLVVRTKSIATRLMPA